MKAVILAGGLGTRLSEETHLKPKPMVEVGSKPILWHILKIYSHFGVNEFIICCGYKGYVIKEYFSNYFLHTSDVTFHMDIDNYMEVHHRKSEPWKVTLVDTGDLSQTGGRLGRVREYRDDSSFCFTYGDGVADVDISNLIAHHSRQVATERFIWKEIWLISSRKSPMETMLGSMVASLCSSQASWIASMRTGRVLNPMFCLSWHLMGS